MSKICLVQVKLTGKVYILTADLLSLLHGESYLVSIVMRQMLDLCPLRVEINGD